MAAQMTLVTGYINPDLDAYACALAYAELRNVIGQSSQAASYGQPLAEVDFALNYTGQKLLPSPNPSTFEQIIIVDASRISSLDTRIDPQKVIEVIDHRAGNDPNLFPNATLQIELVGAAATLIAEKFFTAHIQPSQTTAIFLLAAIISNTLNFQFFQTSERDRHMARYLADIGQAPADFAQQLYIIKSDLTGDKLARQLRDDFSTTDPVNNRTIGLGQIELMGGERLIKSRLDEILNILNQLQQEQQTEFIFTALADVESGKTYFITSHQPSQQLLTQTLGLSFQNNVAKHKQLLLRKQYFNQLKALL